MKGRILYRRGFIVSVLFMVATALAVIPATREEIHWQWTAYKDKAGNYESYLKNWPDGRHGDEARKLYDERSWSDARLINTFQGFQRYLQANPKGRHIADARDKQAALLRDDAPFLKARKKGTEETFKSFLADYPGHKREADARSALKDMEGRDIVDLIREKKVEVVSQGSGIESVLVKLRRLVPHPVTVRIPVGTFFVSRNRSAQNMVTTVQAKHTLSSDDWVSISVSAACANRPRDIPGSNDSFTVQRSPQQAELAKLMPVLNKAGVGYAIRQAAVWIVTDNADYSDLGILVSRPVGQISGGARTIKEKDAARAMRICEEAGIDITKKAIWHDRQQILKGLEEGDLKRWLAQRS